MRRTRLVPLVVAALAAAAAGAPPAPAAEVGPVAEIRPPARFPVDLPGGFSRGERIPRGWVLLRRRARLDPGDGPVRARFRCPGRRLIRTLAMNDPSDLGFRIPRSQSDYTRRSTLTMTLFRSPIVDRGEPARGRAYVLCRRAG